MVPEDREIFPALTVEQNLRLGAFIRGDREEYRRDLGEMFAAVPDPRGAAAASPPARCPAASSSSSRSPGR